MTRVRRCLYTLLSYLAAAGLCILQNREVIGERGPARRARRTRCENRSPDFIGNNTAPSVLIFFSPHFPLLLWNRLTLKETSSLLNPRIRPQWHNDLELSVVYLDIPLCVICGVRQSQSQDGVVDVEK